jgi:hypothetical protein
MVKTTAEGLRSMALKPALANATNALNWLYLFDVSNISTEMQTYVKGNKY